MPKFCLFLLQNALSYAKTNDAGTLKKLIEKAPEIEPIDHFANHCWHNFSFLNNYEAAINDIDKIASLNLHDIDFKFDGVFYLNLLIPR